MAKKADQTRLLFVEDEEGIRLTLATLLTKNGFDVTAVATVGDALTHINCEKFDVLLSDLNIEKPGDGFVVISAMRYAQPHCISLVLTAYPSFENAMEAIQHQVDEFFTKPTDINILIEKIKGKLEARRLKIPVPFKRLAIVLRDNCGDIVAKLTSALKSDPIISAAHSSTQSEDRLPKIMDALIEYLDVGRNGLNSEALALSTEHGRRRKKQGYDAKMMVREFQLIDEAICEVIAGDKMPAAPVGLTTDLMKLTKGLNALMIAALEPYLGAQQPSSVSSRRTAK
jgi:ActR/RegA family two-component response regulator